MTARHDAETAAVRAEHLRHLRLRYRASDVAAGAKVARLCALRSAVVGELTDAGACLPADPGPEDVAAAIRALARERDEYRRRVAGALALIDGPAP